MSVKVEINLDNFSYYEKDGIYIAKPSPKRKIFTIKYVVDGDSVPINVVPHNDMSEACGHSAATYSILDKNICYLMVDDFSNLLTLDIQIRKDTQPSIKTAESILKLLYEDPDYYANEVYKNIKNASSSLEDCIERWNRFIVLEKNPWM